MNEWQDEDTSFATTSSGDGSKWVVSLSDLNLRYGKVLALDSIQLNLPRGKTVGLIGPDGAGKSSLLAIIAGARKIQSGHAEVLGGDMADSRHRRSVCPRVAYMPQGLGRNLFQSLSVSENVDFFARLFGHDHRERERRIGLLLKATGLAPFSGRPAGKLSGGMKQKLGLCCALIHDPDLLILDEPTTGVDPLSRRQFWELINRIRTSEPEMSVLIATAYMEEALSFEWLVAMDDGRVLATGTPKEILSRTRTSSLEEAFIALLPEQKRRGHRRVEIARREAEGRQDIAIEARDLTMCFGDFVAVDHVSFRIHRGEIFGFLGSNGCGKTTTMKMLTGLLPASEGKAWLFGKPIDPRDLQTRCRVGYMSQSFSLYSELSVRQNLVLHARLFRLPAERIPTRVDEMAECFGLSDAMDSLPDNLPLGQRQRLSLAVAMIHEPEMLILDEPTSGVDPVARDGFWQILIQLSRREKVTIFVSTHFMNEAERCDRISLMHAGQVLVSDSPSSVVQGRNAKTLEEAFVRYLEEAAALEITVGEEPSESPDVSANSDPLIGKNTERRRGRFFSLRRLASYSHREALEVRRDPIRVTLAVLGSAILLFIFGYGVTLDVENLAFAVLDFDQTTTSREYVLNLAGSRYFVQRAPIKDYTDLDRRMRSGEISLAIEIPPQFARDMARGAPVSIGAWVDGAMPTRGETVRSYVQGIHAQWLSIQAARDLSGGQRAATTATIEVRFRYNPDVKSLPAMVPAVISILLMLIPATLAAISVVREKELGSIVNFYVTPVTRAEFLIGKQIPYIAVGMLNFLILTGLATTLFGVPISGSFLALAAGALLYVGSSTAIGLLISTFVRSQVAAIFATAVLSILPTTQFSGMIDPVSSLKGVGAFIGLIYPCTYFVNISRGVFNKALHFADLRGSFVPLVIAVPVLIASCVLLLRKQES